MNYIPHPDYGPCDGRAMVDYLVNKLGWVRCGKRDGAIFAYFAGAFGHTGMVVDAANNIVNDANWTPLRVSTHYLNLDAVGAIYACPKSILEAENPKPASVTTTPAPAPQSVPSNEVSYTYQTGDTFGAVILKLGLQTDNGLWGDKAKLSRRANEATIILKTAMICEYSGIDEAMKYYSGTHSEDEYQEFRTSIVLTD